MSERMRRRKLGSDIIALCIAFALIVSLGTGIIGYFTFYKNIMDQYDNYLKDMLNETVAVIDGDDLQECIKTLEKSEKYYETQEFLDNLKNNSSIEYIYILQPLNLNEENNMMYVMTGVRDNEKYIYDDVITLGNMTGTEYSPDFAQIYINTMTTTGDIVYHKNNTEFGYMYTAMKPIHNSKGEPICVLSIDYSMNKLYDTIKRFVIYEVLGCIMLSLIFILFQIVWLRRRVVNPLSSLEKSAVQLYESSHNATTPDDMKFEKPYTSVNDEISSLSDTLERMAENLKRNMNSLVKESQSRERIESELGVATRIQRRMIPNVFPDTFKTDGIDMYAEIDQAPEMGGSFYDYYVMDDDHLAFVIADVSGKGVSAALFMVIAKTMIRNQLINGTMSPAEAFENVNNHLCHGNDFHLDVSAWLGILEISTGRIVVANAGHNSPAIGRKGRKYEICIDTYGPPLGAMSGISYQEYEIVLEKGDTLFLYTDGIIDTENPNDEKFGINRMLEILNDNPRATIETLLKNMKTEIDLFMEGVRQKDDIAMMGIRLSEDE